MTKCAPGRLKSGVESQYRFARVSNSSAAKVIKTLDTGFSSCQNLSHVIAKPAHPRYVIPKGE